MPEAATSEKRLVAQTNHGRDGQWSYSNRCYHMVWTAAVLLCGGGLKPTRLLLFLDSFLKKQVRMLDASDRDKSYCVYQFNM